MTAQINNLLPGTWYIQNQTKEQAIILVIQMQTKGTRSKDGSNLISASISYNTKRLKKKNHKVTQKVAVILIIIPRKNQIYNQ